jgi:hypothetical protein
MDKESPLENGLVKFVEDHSETFTDVASIRRSIIRAFATFQFHQQYSGILRAGQQHYSPPGLKHLAIIILKAITGRIMSGNNFTSENIQDILNNFDLCVEFIQTFVKKEPGLCTYEMRHNGLGGEVSDVQPCIDFMNSLVIPPRPLRVFVNMELNMNHAIWTNSKMRINLYHSRVLKLWAEILIGINKIKNDVIEQMKQRMSATTGSTQPMRIDAFGRSVPMTSAEAAQAAIVSTFGNPANMSLETLLNVLTFIHLTSYEQQLDLFLTNGDGMLVNRFVELKDVRGIGNSFIGLHVPNKLNDELQLKCNVIGNADSSLPVQAYLSSDLLDRCVKSIGGFPTTSQFVEFLNMVRQRKAEKFFKKESDLSTVTTSSFGGGKKTIRKTNKKRKRSKNRRHSRHRH